MENSKTTYSSDLYNNRPSNEDLNIYEKIHYDKHIEFLKWIVGIAGTAITVMVAVGLWFTYSNVKEYKDELKGNADAMQTELQEKEKEVVQKEEDMKKSVDDLLSYTKEEVQNTKQQAINQIGTIKTLATDEARNRINEVFESKNLDQFIEQVAEQRIGPRVQNMVDIKMKQIEALSDKKIQDAINNLSNLNLSIAAPSMSYLQQNQDYSFTESQIDELLSQFERLEDGSPIALQLLDFIINLNTKVTLSERQIIVIIKKFKQLPVGGATRPIIISYLSRLNKESIDIFFMDVALNRINGQHQESIIQESARNRFLSPNHLQDFNFYHEYLSQFKNSALIHGQYHVTVEKLSFIDQKLTVQLLNDKEIIDSMFRHTDMFYDIIINPEKASIKESLNPAIPKPIIENTFLFKYSPPDLKIYPQYDNSSPPRRIN